MLQNEMEEPKLEPTSSKKGGVPRQTSMQQAQQIRRTMAGQLDPSMQKKTLTLETYLQENFNTVQASIISFFEPIAKQSPQ